MRLGMLAGGRAREIQGKRGGASDGSATKGFAAPHMSPSGPERSICSAHPDVRCWGLSRHYWAARPASRLSDSIA